MTTPNKTVASTLEDFSGQELVDSDAFSIVSGATTTRNLDDGEAVKRGTNWNAKLVWLAFLLITSALVLATYFLLKARETAQFETAFMIFARETSVMADNHAENTFGQLASLASAVRTVIADEDNATQRYPHQMTIPQFDMRVNEIAKMTGIEMLLFVPFVPVEEKEAFENYQVENQEWIQEAYDYRDWDMPQGMEIPPHIHNFTGTFTGSVKMPNKTFIESMLVNHTYTYNGSTCYAPVVQAGPALTDASLVMMDLFSHPKFRKEMIASLEYSVPVVSEIGDVDFLLEHIAPPESTGEFDWSMPRSFTLDQVKATYEEDSKTVGFMVGIIQWNMLFRNFLPKYINGIIVEIISDCGSSFTYVVNGGKDDEWTLDAEQEHPYGDTYQYLQQQYKFFWKEHPKGTGQHCHFDLLITPSGEFAQQFMTNTPLIWAAIVLAIILITTIAFLVYDKINQRRQQRITQDKERAEAVVSSLFPKQVRQQLMDGHTPNKSKKGESYLAKDHENLDAMTGAAESKQIAQLYPSATIIFSDLAGFTAWSATKDPPEVFKLLETIYGAFDEIAKARKVFKIETIGDCYVAVCGLPDPRKNHAIVMARFAQDCMEKFNELVAMLDAELPGTASLKLRTGLHSGPVTAGVLRGDRARFQLFGDSVNTTARVETTGMGGKIHVSEQFAEELVKFNKAKWLIPRDELVQAKGKGTLRTFWLQVQNRSSDTASLMSDFLEPSDVVERKEPAMTNFINSVVEEPSSINVERKEPGRTTIIRDVVEC